MHAINSDPAFVTSDHPFLTPQGWKAIDPQILAGQMEQFYGLALLPLQSGDQLVNSVGGLVRIKEIRTEARSPSTTV